MDINNQMPPARIAAVFGAARTINWKSPKTLTALGVIVAVAALVLIRAGGNEEQAPAETQGVRVLETMTLSTLSESASATVVMRSDNEAAVRAESGGKVSRVPAKAGATVGGGSVLAEIENSAQRAALTQAEGALEGAKASLEKVRRGLRSEKVAVLETSLDSAKGGAVTALLTAYGAVDSAVEDTADQMFTGVEQGQPNFSVLTSDKQREIDLEQRRALLIRTLDREAAASPLVSKQSDLKAELNTTEAELRDARTFMDILLAALADAIPNDQVTSSDIASYKSDATAARTSITSALSGITSARAGLATAEKSLEESLTGAENTELAGAEATVKQAEGAYAAALSAYQKTIIRSPVAGVIRVVNIASGDYLQPGQEIAIVSVTDTSTAKNQTTRVPLTALKMEVNRTLVFTIEEGRLVGIPVELGTVSGESVEVSGALSPEMRIVIDARGLKEGDEARTE